MRVDAADAASAAAGDGLDEHGIADLIGALLEELRRLVVAVIAGQDRDARARHHRLGAALQPHRPHRLRRRTDEGDALEPAIFREIGVLAEKAIAGMQALRPRPARRRHDRLPVEIARRLDRLVGEPREQRAAVGGRVQGDGAHAQALRRCDDATGDLAAIGDQHIGEQASLPRRRTFRAYRASGRGAARARRR